MRSLLLACTVALAAGPALATPTVQPGDMSLGNAKARVEVIEYASVACPHCAHFNETVVAPFRVKWVDTGKARFVLKEMLTASPTVAMAGFLIARCAGPAKYFKVVDEIYKSQPQWVEGQIKPVLQKIAADNGLDEARFNACLQDQAAIDAVNARAQRAFEQDGVDSTPTVFINGKKLDKLPQTPAEMDAAIAAAAPKAAAGKAAAKKKGGQ